MNKQAIDILLRELKIQIAIIEEHNITEFSSGLLEGFKNALKISEKYQKIERNQIRNAYRDGLLYGIPLKSDKKLRETDADNWVNGKYEAT
jgi:hypothetical protein